MQAFLGGLEQTLGFQHRGLATLQQILEPLEASAAAEATEIAELSEEDLEGLQRWLSPCYLRREHLEVRGFT